MVPPTSTADATARVDQPELYLASRPVGADLQAGRQMGAKVLTALGFESGFTHMEWYRTADGEAVFGEIGVSRPAPGWST